MKPIKTTKANQAQADRQVTPTKKKKGHIIVVERDLLNSKAWLSLNGISPQVYLLFLCRRKMEKTGPRNNRKTVCTNSKELIFTYRDAENDFGITQPRFTKTIDMLITHGFLDIVEPGNGSTKTATTYGLSHRWEKYGTADFEPKPRVPVKRGFCDGSWRVRAQTSRLSNE
jgi:hypothetical protein